MMSAAACRRILWAWSVGCACAAGTALAAEPGPRTVLLDVAKGWQATFDAQTSVLECRHGVSGSVLVGRLAFSGTLRGKPTKWSVEPARDAFPQRLALIDGRNDVQGYVIVQGSGLRLSLTAIHRPPHRDQGTLTYTPEITFGREAFACRTRVASDAPVVQMASGPADSRLNDSLFDAQRDLALRFDGRDVALSTVTTGPGAAVKFRGVLCSHVAKSDAATVSVEVLPDYYRSRYAPRYRLIDRKRCPKAPTGWMAWNVYFDAATEGDDLAEARVAAKHLKQFGLEFWSIESWQDNSPRLPVSNFHNLTMRPSPEKFPHGMKWLAEQIRALGFRPGIWTVSFGTGDENFYKAHRDWFLHDRDGRPMKNWNGRFVLDPSQAAVRQYTEQTHRQMAQEWGYEFFKSDGMSGSQSSYSAHFFERPEVRAAFREPCADPYGMWVEALRRGIGRDRVLLACQGHYTGPDPAVADATRIGGDLVHFPQTPHWSDYLNQARATQSQLFTNNLLWYNDPDTLMVGEHAPMSVARIATTVVALPGQLTFFGDKLTRLPSDRMRLLQQSLPVCDVRPMDLLPLDELKPVWDLKIRRPFGCWDVVSVFNWDDAATTQRVTFAELGLDAAQEYLVYEFWSHKFLGLRKDFVELPLEPHANVLLAIRPRSDRPQLLSSDRHVSQGGVELLDMAWNAQRAELACTFDLVADDPLTACFYVPPSFRFVGATVAEAKLEKVTEGTDATVTVTVRRASSGKAEVRLKFRAAN